VLDLSTMEYKYNDIHNPKPFLQFKITSIEDLETGNERLVNY